jgi:hypothetical protein
VHSSERRGNTVWTSVSVRQVKGFPSQTQIWEDSCNHPEAILDKARRGEELQLFGRHGNIVRMPVLIMEIVCSRSATVWTLGKYSSDAALFRKYFQHFLESWLHSCLSGRP